MAHSGATRSGGDDPPPHEPGPGPSTGDDAHRPTGLDLDALETREQIAAEERERHGALPVAFRLLDSVINVVMVVLLVALVVSVAINVSGRVTGWWSVPAAGEIARFIFIWVIFLGAALAHLHNEHIAVSLLVERLPRRGEQIVVVLQELTILVVAVALLLSARQVMAISPGSSPLLDVPLQLINFAVPFCAVLMALITIYRIAVGLRAIARGKG